MQELKKQHQDADDAGGDHFKGPTISAIDQHGSKYNCKGQPHLQFCCDDTVHKSLVPVLLKPGFWPPGLSLDQNSELFHGTGDFCEKTGEGLTFLWRSDAERFIQAGVWFVTFDR